VLGVASDVTQPAGAEKPVSKMAFVFLKVFFLRYLGLMYKKETRLAFFCHVVL